MTFQIGEPDGDDCTGYMTDGMYEALNGPGLARVGDTVEVPLRLPEEETPRKLSFVIRSWNDPGMTGGDVILPRKRTKALTEGMRLQRKSIHIVLKACSSNCRPSDRANSLRHTSFRL